MTQDDFDWLNEDDDRLTATMWEQSDGTWIVNSEGSQFDSSFTTRFTDSVDAQKYMDKVNRGELTKQDVYNDEMGGYRSLESKASEGYVNIDDDGFYNPIGISDVPSIIGGIAKGYGKKLVKPFQEDKSGDWEIQVKDDNGGWKTYEYGGHYVGKDGADHDAKNLSKVNRVVRKGSGYESKAKESSDVFLYEPTNDVDGVGYWWDFELPLDENKERKTFEDLDIQYGKAWGYLTQDEKERVSNYKSKSSESTIYKESWNQANSIKRIEALEKIGIKQGDAIKLSGLEFEDFGEDLQDALKGDIEDARTQMKQDKHELDGLGDYNPNDSEDAKTTGLGWQEGGEVENPNSEFQQYYPDYNNIGESQTNRTKYECEYCDHGFKSNEALMVHHNDKHAISKETLDGYATEDSWASPMINKGQTYSKSLHSDYKYGINDELILICDICGWEAGIVDRDNNDDSVHDRLEEHIASVHNIVRDYWAESYVRKAKYTGNEGLSLAEWSKMQDENGWYRVGVSGATPEIEDTAKAMGGSWHGQGGDGYNVTEWTFHNHSDAENFAQYVEGKSITIDHGTDHADYGLDSRYLPTEQHYVEGPYDASPYVFDSTGSHNIGSGAIGGSPLRDNPFGESKANEYYGKNEPDKLLITIRCEKCYDVIRGEFDIDVKRKAHDHLIDQHEYTWLPTKRKFEHDEQNRIYQKMISNMEYSKVNYSDNVFESRASEYMSLIGDTPEQYWSMGGLNSIEEDLELYNEDSQNASSYPIYSRPDTTKLWSDLSDQEKSDIQTLFHFMSGGGETDFYDQESYSRASEAPHTIAEPDSTPQGDNYPTYYFEMSSYPYMCRKCGETVGSDMGGYIQSMIDHLTEWHGITELSVEQTWNESKANETFDMHSDAGHGWLEVPKSLLKELGIGKDISMMSYQKGNSVFIEEDGDLSTFKRAYEEKYGSLSINELPQTDESPIRDYYPYGGESKAREMGDVLINDTPYGTWTDADGNQHQGDYTQSYGTSYTDGNRTIVDVPDDKEKSFGDMLKDEGYDWIEDQQYYGYKEFEKDGKYYNPTKEPPWNEDEYEAKYGIDRSIASNRFRRGESKASETKAEIAYWWDNMSPYERENIVDEYGVGYGLYDGDYNKTYNQIENDGGDQFNRAEIDAIFTNHVINKQTGLDRKDLIKDQSHMGLINGQIPSNTWDDTEYDYFYKQGDDKSWVESKASEAGLEDHSCPECEFITSDNSEYIDHLNAHED
jgi:hypothetical protein